MKRINGDLFRAGDGRVINTDVNGSASMIGKAFSIDVQRLTEGNTGRSSTFAESNP